MSLNNNLYQLMSTSEVANSKDIQSMDFVLNLEVLNQCKHRCSGCYVSRKNDLLDVDLNVALQLAQAMNDKNVRFREIILSPTDLFSASNSLEVLNDNTFQQLLNIHPKTRITTTAMFENLDWDNWCKIWDTLDNTRYFKSNMIMEFLVPINVKKVLHEDTQYYDQFQQALEFMSLNTPKEVDWSFVINVQYDKDIAENYDQLTQLAKTKFNTTIEFLPSFFRTNNDRLISQRLHQWKDLLNQVITRNNYKDIMLTIADKHHNGFNTIVINYRRGRMYISPFIYEQILFQYPELQVDGFDADQVINKNNQLIIDQFDYAEKTTDCKNCEYLSTCVGRNVLSFMEIKQLTKCIYPKNILDLYVNDDISKLSMNKHQCASTTTLQ